LNSTCFLFRACDIKNRDCDGCYSGPSECTSCEQPYSDGGRWYFQHEDLHENITQNDKGFYTCGSELRIATVCTGGNITFDDTKLACLCKKQNTNNVTCTNDEKDGGFYQAGTTCTKKCADGRNWEASCDNGNWDGDLTRFACEVDVAVHSEFLIIGLSVVGGLVIVTALIVFYFLGVKTNFVSISGGKPKRSRHLSTIHAYGEPNEERSVKGSERNQKTEEPETRPYWNGSIEIAGERNDAPQPSGHYRFERAPERTQQQPYDVRGTEPQRLYQQSRHMYQSRGYRPATSEQPISRGTSVAEHQI